ncbi:MAG: anti-sigma factor [Candidatus Dormibacteraceae bacterium]
MIDHEELASNVAAYLLGALDTDEALDVRRHLATCRPCRELAAQLTMASSVLPLAAEEVKPPPRLKQQILAAASARRSAPDPTLQPAAPADRLPRLQMPTGRVMRWRRFGFAAALVAVCLLGWNVYLTAQLLSRSPSPTPIGQFALTGSGLYEGAGAKVLEFHSSGVALVQFQGLPGLDSAHVYQLWLLPRAGAPVSGGVFVPQPNGSSLVVVTRDLGAFQQMAVTVERGPSGAKSPTQTPQISGRIG